VLQLINAYRFLGNRWAQLDPLKRSERPSIPELEPSHYGFTEADLGQVFADRQSFAAVSEQATLREILEALRQTYCGTIGAEYMYLSDVGAEALDPEQNGADPLDAGLHRERKEALPGATHPRRDAGALPAHQAMSGRSASRSKAAKR
jgi:hypothetical protein